MEEEIVNPNDYSIDWDGPTPESNDNNVVVDESRIILTDNQYNLLRSLINPLEEDNNGYGINIYKKNCKCSCSTFTKFLIILLLEQLKQIPSF